MELSAKSLTRVKTIFVLQISDNVVTHQFNRYVVSKGKDPYALTSVEKDALMADMKNDLYPGRRVVVYLMYV